MRRSMVVAVAVCALIGPLSGSVVGQGNLHPAAERFVLSGVVFLENGSGIAWLREQSLTGDRVVPVRPGESIGPYRLSRILEDRVELQGPGGTVLVPVYTAGAGSGTAVASASSGVAAGVAAGAAPARPAAGPDAAAMSGLVNPEIDAVMRAMAPQVDAGAMTALRERLELARRQSEQGRAPTAGAEQRAPGQVRAPGPAAGAPSRGNGDVVYPEKGQTFQSILGLK